MKTKKYILNIWVEDGKLKMSSQNEGLNVFELMGALQTKIYDVQKQLWNEISPDIERIVKIEENENNS